MIIKEIKTERGLAPTGIDLADFVINPYTGCQFGCCYCYSRSNKNVSKVPHEWGRFLFVKKNLPEILEKEINECKKEIKKVLIGSTTDPFQPAERNYRLTREVLSILKKKNIPCVILTRSPLISEYLDILQYSDENTIYFTYNSEEVNGLIDNYRIKQSARLTTIESIKKSSINNVVYVSPVFPGLIDIESVFNELKGRAEKIYFENYNIRLGNWQSLKQKLSNEQIEEYENIFLKSENYKEYWDSFVSDVNRLNQDYGYKLDFFIYPFNSYYKNAKAAGLSE
jgi:DNA repair photolyase